MSIGDTEACFDSVSTLFDDDDSWMGSPWCDLNGEANPIPPNAPQNSPDSELSEDDRRLIDDTFHRVGFAALAFYKSRRYVSSNPYRNNWGIFYFEQGEEWLRDKIKNRYPTINDPSRLAHEFLRKHEWVHFQFDIYVLCAEMNFIAGCYDMANRNNISQQRVRRPSLYSIYHRNYWRCMRKRMPLWEEALANHHAWKWAGNKKIGIKDFAEELMNTQPPGYNLYNEKSDRIKQELAAQLYKGSQIMNPLDEQCIYWIDNGPRRLQCPEFTVNGADLTRIR